MNNLKFGSSKEEMKKYRNLGFSVIPIGSISRNSSGKKDIQFPIEWKEYQSRIATLEEIESWNYGNVAVVTGKISDLLVLDTDSYKENFDHELLKSFNIPRTPVQKTASGGNHYFFKRPKNLPYIKSDVCIGHRESGIDIKADGGLAIVSPSTASFGEYNWVISPFDEPLADVPSKLLELLTSKLSGSEKRKKQLTELIDLREGEGRNNAISSLIGKLLLTVKEDNWDTEIWPMVLSVNNTYSPPLEIKELRSIYESITKIHKQNKVTLEQKIDIIKNNQSDKLVEIIKDKNEAELFYDEYSDAYLKIKENNKSRIIRINSKLFKKWLAKEYWDIYKKTPNGDSIKTAINVLEGIACFDGGEHKLANRLSWNDNCLWYDLINDNWETIKISEEGWNIDSNPPILFKRYSHNLEQVLPSTSEKDAKLILNYVNITDQKQKILFLVYMISCFIPDFPHPLLVIFGQRGSAKSTLSKLLRNIIDPSLIEVSSLVENHKELVQALAHHSFIFFDNVSHISESISDTLCKAITGSGFIKRELYENDEDIIYQLKRCIGINGINIVSTKPDLLDRSIMIELERIPESNRKEESELIKDFKEDLPKILGGIFDVLSKTLKIKRDIKLDNLPRMADFALWGSAISEALGYSKEEFIEAYKENIDKQKDTVLNDNLIAIVLNSFMSKRYWESWNGTSSELLENLKNQAISMGIDTRDKYWPKAPNILSRALNTLKTTFEENGVKITNSVTSDSRVISIEKMENFDDSMHYDDTTIDPLEF